MRGSSKSTDYPQTHLPSQMWWHYHNTSIIGPGLPTVDACQQEWGGHNSGKNSKPRFGFVSAKEQSSGFEPKFPVVLCILFTRRKKCVKKMCVNICHIQNGQKCRVKKKVKIVCSSKNVLYTALRLYNWVAFKRPCMKLRKFRQFIFHLCGCISHSWTLSISGST